MGIYRGPGGGGDATVDTELNTFISLKDQALQAANEAEDSAAGALASENAAANSALAADASADAAALSETNAAASAASAAGVYDSFDDRYLGAKMSAPTLDNDGNALLEGALYWNTTSKTMNVWNSTSWIVLTGGSVTTQNFSGDGVTTVFALTVSPISENNTQVYINGVYQQKNTYTVSSNVLTFSEAPLEGTDNIEVIQINSLPLGSTSADLVSYSPLGTGAVATNVQSKLREFVSVFDFMTAGEIASVQARDLAADVTAAVQAGMNRAIAIGAVLFFPAGWYKITDTISLTNANYSYAGGMQGENGNSTRIYFYNSTSLKNMFYVDDDVNYLTVSDLEFIDNTARTSRAFYFFDNSTVSTSPSWKHLFRNVRITQFKEGVRWDGGASPLQDTHQSEVMFLHSKFRNCETSLIYNNIQAVNHQLIGLDIENDAAGDVAGKWVMIKFERGSYVNHFGGSVIGYGPYVQYTFPNNGDSFQQTDQFQSVGVRLEARGDGPFIDHNTSSNMTLSHFFRLIFEGLSVSVSNHVTPVLARFGGKSLAVFKECNANVQMAVQAYMTTNLSAGLAFGNIVIERCKAINYERVSSVTAYGSAGVAASNYRAIPAEISYQNEGATGQNDGAGYYTLNNPLQTIYAGGWQPSQIKTLVFANADTSGFGSGSNPATAQVNLPRYARPLKFRVLRDAFTTGSPFVFTLIFVVSGVDYTVATITPGATNYGHFEANISLPTAMTQAINDGVVWDGKMKVQKSGSVTGFTGLIMIDYM